MKHTSYLDELKTYRQWCWSSLIDLGDNKKDKAPRTPDGRLASVSDPTTWGTFEDCLAKVQAQGGAMGFVLTPNDPYAVIDIDKTDDPKILAGQKMVWEGFPDTYAEYSQSGEGVHIVMRGNIGGGVRRKKIEVYDRGRYIIFTGNAIRKLPITAQHQPLSELVAGLGGIDAPGDMPESMPEEHTDEQILETIRKATNGAKFVDLYYTTPGAGDDWSARDAALAQFIAFYTRNHDQALRLFRGSALYNPERKASKSGYKSVDSYEQGYLLGRTFKKQWQHLAPDYYHRDRGREFADVVLNNWHNEQKEALALSQAQAEALVEYNQTQALNSDVAVPENSIPMPPGLVGTVARYVYETSPSPIWEIAVASAITFCSAIFGNKWRTATGNGLGHYVVLLADSGVGKSAGTARVDALARAIEDTGNMLMSHLAGPGYLASGQALLKLLAEQPVVYSFLSEFGETMRRLDPANASDSYIEFRRVLLEVFDAERIKASAYAQKKDSTEKVDYPVVSFLGDTRAEDFFSLVDEQFARSGFLARLTVIEYAGPIPQRPANYRPHVPADLVDVVGGAVLACNREAGGVHAAPMDVEAGMYFDQLGQERVQRMNEAPDELERGAWNRLDLRILRLATVIAVGENWVHPTVTLAHMKWAEGIVRFGLEYTLGQRLKQGATGDGEQRFVSDVVDCVQWYATASEKQRINRKTPPSIAKLDNVFAYTTFKKFVSRKSRYNNHRTGSENAIEIALKGAMKEGLIAEVPTTMYEHVGYTGSQKLYRIGDDWNK